MPAIAERTSAELKQHIDRLTAELEELSNVRLPAALKSMALAFVGGRNSDEVSSVRTQLRRTKDLVSGLTLLAEETELAELEAEIAQREAAMEKDAVHVENLRQAAMRGEAVPEGVGSEFASARRRDREERIDAFHVYERANIRLLEEKQLIEPLKRRRCELAGQTYVPPPKRLLLT